MLQFIQYFVDIFCIGMSFCYAMLVAYDYLVDKLYDLLDKMEELR